jgi:two-component system response regulator LytT
LAYLLKPIDADELNNALNKYEHLYKDPAIYELLGRISNRYQKRFLIQSGSTLDSIPDETIAYFYVEEKHLFICTLDGKKYLFDSTLESLENRLDPKLFFRINRQIIVSLHSIKKMHSHTRGRVQLETIPPFKEEMIVSIDRAPEFKIWLNH